MVFCNVQGPLRHILARSPAGLQWMKKMKTSMPLPADYQGEFQGDPVHLPPLGAGGVGKGEDEAEDDEKAGDECGAPAKHLFYGGFQGLAGYGRRNGGGKDVEGKTAGRGIHPLAGKGAEKTAGQLDNIPPEVEAEGNERPQMKGHIESESRFGPVEESRDQDQVGGAADGKDLGQPLERAE